MKMAMFGKGEVFFGIAETQGEAIKLAQDKLPNCFLNDYILKVVDLPMLSWKRRKEGRINNETT